MSLAVVRELAFQCVDEPAALQVLGDAVLESVDVPDDIKLGAATPTFRWAIDVAATLCPDAGAT